MLWAKIRLFLIRERLYIWLLLFIVCVNCALFLTKGPAYPEKKSSEVELLQKKIFTKEELSEFLNENKPLGALLLFFTVAVVFAVAFGLFLDFIILIIKKEGAPLIFPTILPQSLPGWRIWDVCKVAILFLWFGYMLVFIESFFAEQFPALKNDNLRSLLNATVTDSLAFFFIMYFALHKYREGLASLGLSLKNFFKNLFYGLAGYLAVLPLLVLALIAVIALSSFFKYEPPMQPVLEIFLEEKKRAVIVYLTVFVAVFGPIAEEAFFRVFMYRAVRQRWGFKIALVSTSLLFAILHASLIGFLPILILGMLLAYLFEKTGTLVAPCAVHILHNSVMVALVFVMKTVLKGAG